MIVRTKNGKKCTIRILESGDIEALVVYFQRLSTETLKRYGPHAFDADSIRINYGQASSCIGLIAIDVENSEIIAYSIVKIGFLDHDRNRLETYGLSLNNETDCTFAPSVADEWQSLGIMNQMFQFILNQVEMKGIRRIILWGGVQQDNDKAVNFYIKNGFRILGHFEYHGWNYDMMLDINR